MLLCITTLYIFIAAGRNKSVFVVVFFYQLNMQGLAIFIILVLMSKQVLIVNGHDRISIYMYCQNATTQTVIYMHACKTQWCVRFYRFGLCSFIG